MESIHISAAVENIIKRKKGKKSRFSIKTQLEKINIIPKLCINELKKL